MIIPILPPTLHPIYHYYFPIIRLFLGPPYTPPHISLLLPHYTIIPRVPPTHHPIYHYYFPIINTTIGITITPSIFSKVVLLPKLGKGVLVEFGSGFRVKGFNYIVIIVYNCLCIIITL